MVKPVDDHVGKRIRLRRWQVDMTQKQLADQVGVKFQQLQKYETGANRVSASRLWQIACALDVSVSFFFEGLRPISDPAPRTEVISAESDTASDLISRYYQIPKPKRKAFLNLVLALAATAPDGRNLPSD